MYGCLRLFCVSLFQGGLWDGHDRGNNSWNSENKFESCGSLSQVHGNTWCFRVSTLLHPLLGLKTNVVFSQLQEDWNSVLIPEVLAMITGILDCNTPQCCKFTLTFSDHHLRTTSLSPNSLRNECKGLVTITDREGLLWGERKLVPLLSFPKEKALRINQLNNTVTTGPFFIACIYFLTFWILCYGLDNLITGNQQFTAMKL